MDSQKLNNILHFYLLGPYYVLEDNLTARRCNYELGNHEGKVAVVTGGHRGIGAFVTRELLSAGFHVILGCRKTDDGKNFESNVRNQGITNGKVSIKNLDLKSLSSVRSFADDILNETTVIDLIVNNAGIITSDYEETVDGFESQWQVNYLSHFLLCHLLLSRLQAAAGGARIVNVTSLEHKTPLSMDYQNINNKFAQDNAFQDYQAARTIQRYYRGHLVRRHLKYLHRCATNIQRHWRGYVDRKFYEQLLKESVHKLYWEHYNNMAAKIQKVWRGHFVRTRVFSYYRLKEYIKGALQMNKEFMEKAKDYEEMTKLMVQQNMEKECQERFAYLSRRVHHLLRTYQIEGIFSNHGTKELSSLEKVLANIKFVDYMKIKRMEAKQKKIKTPHGTNIFEGRMRECEEVWHHRNDPGKYSLATGEYGENERIHKQQEKVENKLRMIHDDPMKFGPVRHNDTNITLDDKPYKCPPLHRSVKNVEE